MSTGSSSCLIDWHPSRLLCVALAGLGLLAAISLGLSDLPPALALPGAVLAAGRGLRLARREWRRPRCTLQLEANGDAVIRTGAFEVPLAAPRLALRGVLATLSWRDPAGRRQSLAWCADTLPVPARRQLRLRIAARRQAAA